MEKSKKQILIVVIVTLSILAIVLGLYLGLPVQKEYINFEVMGKSSLQTKIKVNILSQKEIGDKILNEVETVDKLINPTSKYPSSDVNRINNSNLGEVVKVNKITIELINIAYDVYVATDGNYNPASYYLVDIWNFSAEKYDKIEFTEDGKTATNIAVPTDVQIDLGIRLADTFKDIKFIGKEDTVEQIKEKTKSASFLVDTVNNTVTRQEKAFVNKDKNDETSEKIGAKIDLGGIAKGYAVQKCYDVFESQKVADGLVNLGGNVYTYNKDFLVGLENPFKAIDQAETGDTKNLIGIVNLKNSSVSCSGVYERNYKLDGKMYSHIIDTKTGYPVNVASDGSIKNPNAVVMACVIGKNGAVCDAVATSLVLENTIENAVNFVNNNFSSDISSVILITGNRQYKVIGDVNFNFNENLQGFTRLD